MGAHQADQIPYPQEEDDRERRSQYRGRIACHSEYRDEHDYEWHEDYDAEGEPSLPLLDEIRVGPLPPEVIGFAVPVAGGDEQEEREDVQRPAR